MGSQGERAPSEPVPGLVTLHLWRVPARRVPAALVGVARDRRPVRATQGMLFAKLLGTGNGKTLSPCDADPRRWALPAVWVEPAAARAFEHSATTRRWGRPAEQSWRVDLRPLAARGTIDGKDPLG